MKFINKLFRKKQNGVHSQIAPTPTLHRCGTCFRLFATAFQRTTYFGSTQIACEECRDEIVDNETAEEMYMRHELGESENTLDYYGTEEKISEEILAQWTEAQPPQPAPDYSNEPQVAGFIVVHTRATDRVYFGPFKTVEDIYEWSRKVGAPHRVSGSIYPLMNPQGDPEDFWYIPDEMPWEELVKPKKEREYIP